MAGLALLVGAGCGLITGNDDEDSALDRAELRWSGSGVQDYQIVVQNLCFCGYIRPVRITVRFGAVVSRVDAETGEPVPTYGENVRDIAGLFDLIRDAIAQDAHSLDVKYDATYGFPTLITIDYIRNAIDDELTVKTSEFQRLR
jgi:hypothetical protein